MEGGGLGRGRRREGMEGQGKEDEREEVYEIIRIRAFTIIRDYSKFQISNFSSKHCIGSNLECRLSVMKNR